MCKCTPEIRTPFCGKLGCECPGPQKVVNLASKATSGMTWSPAQLLREFLEAVETGKETPIMLAVAWMEKTKDDRMRPRYWQAGCSKAEQAMTSAPSVVRVFKATQVECAVGYDHSAWFVYDRSVGEAAWHRHCEPYAAKQDATDWILAIRLVQIIRVAKIRG